MPATATEMHADSLCVISTSSRLYAPAGLEAMALCQISAACNLTTATGNAAITTGLTFDRAIDDMLVLLGIQNTMLAAGWMRDRAVNDMNAAFQRVWIALQDMNFIGSTTLQMSFAAGESAKLLPHEVQHVAGNVRLADDETPLLPLRSRGQLQSYGAIYGEESGPPMAYFVETDASQGSSDGILAKLHIVPAPQAQTSVKLSVIQECPRYEWADYDRKTILPIPHQYAETCLLPIGRYLASGSSLFTAHKLKDQIDRDYESALQMLRLSDPDNEATTRTQERRETATTEKS